LTVSSPPTSVRETAPEPQRPHKPGRRGPWLVALVIVLAVAFGLRVWGSEHGLPFAYNPDESGHFVLRAVRFHETGDFNPHYFINPPGLTYIFYGAFAVRYRGSEGVAQAFKRDPGSVYLSGRLVVAMLGTLGVLFLYMAGARLFDRRVGLLAAALLAVSFLAVSWSHQAVNDVPTTAAVAVALLGTAGILHRGAKLDYALAGAGLGAACAVKYTAGIVILPLLAAAAFRFRRERVSVVPGLPLAAGTALLVFFVLNPYALLAPREFADQLLFLSVTPEGEEKLGQADDNGVLYYLWALSWGLGWIPSLAALGGAAMAVVRDRAIALLLVPAPVLYIVFMGVQERYFGRWLLPVIPIICLLAAYGALSFLDAIRRMSGRLVAAAATAAVVAALLAQSAFFSVHGDLVLSRTDTRNVTREWMFENVPRRSLIFADRILPSPWYRNSEDPSPRSSVRRRWTIYPLERALAVGRLASPAALAGGIEAEDHTRLLQPELISVLEQEGVCLVVTGSGAYGRAFAEPDKVPQAVAFYQELARRADVAFRASPYKEGEGPVPFNFDWATNYYPLAYERPGFEMIVYRLSGGRCAA
jgi:Dolichyl-phosphate-mannose-protein mannosyltransferase